MDHDEDDAEARAVDPDGPYVCPVCGFDGLREPPYNADGDGSYEICPCCGFEYGYDDHSEGVSHDEFRANWLAAGAEWFDEERRPDDWDLRAQLARIGHEADVDADAG